MGEQGNRPLRDMVDAVQDIADTINSPNPRVKIQHVVRCFRLVGNFISYFGIAFQFAKLDLEDKANSLEEACKEVETVEELIEMEVAQGCEKEKGSHCRNLVRVKRGSYMIKLFFEQLLTNRENSLLAAFRTAYNEVFARYHGSTVLKAMSASMEDLVTKTLLFGLMNETEDSGNELMHKYIAALTPVVEYGDILFQSNAATKELLRMI